MKYFVYIFLSIAIMGAWLYLCTEVRDLRYRVQVAEQKLSIFYEVNRDLEETIRDWLDAN